MNKSHDLSFRAMPFLNVVANGDKAVFPAADEDSHVVIKDLGFGLLSAYVVDIGGSLACIQQRHLTEAGVSAEQLHAQSIQNLGEFAQEKAKVHPHGKIHVVLAGGNFEASLILLPQFWSDWYAKLAPNGFVAAFPARDLLAFADAKNPQAIEELHEACAKAKGKVDHPLTSQLFTYVGGQWRPYN